WRGSGVGGRAGAFGADPVVQEEVLGGDVALPFVLAAKGRVAVGKVEDAVEGAEVLLFDVGVEVGLGREVALFAGGTGEGSLAVGVGVGGGGGGGSGKGAGRRDVVGSVSCST